MGEDYGLAEFVYGYRQKKAIEALGELSILCEMDERGLVSEEEYERRIEPINKTIEDKLEDIHSPIGL
jgi:hypothetical protein